jgi:hypothetical protein
MDDTIVASCTCGSFQFKSSRAPILQLTCHCQDCRDVAKQPSTNFAFFKLTAAEVQGATVLHHFVADSGAKTLRETCASCGDALLDRTEGFPKIVGVVAERIQPPFVFQARCHVWAASKTTDTNIPEGMQTFARSMA